MDVEALGREMELIASFIATQRTAGRCCDELLEGQSKAMMNKIQQFQSGNDEQRITDCNLIAALVDSGPWTPSQKNEMNAQLMLKLTGQRSDAKKTWLATVSEFRELSER